MGEIDRTIMVTGAAGFIGRHCVKYARERGHAVIAVVRSKTSIGADWQNDPMIEIIVTDLAKVTNPKLAQGMRKAGAIIHAAASLTGKKARHADDTVLATQNLCHEMQTLPRSQRKLILVSSITVYNAAALQEGCTLDENTPLENYPDQRDIYCQSKLSQEMIALAAAKANILDLFIMRPGAVYGPGRLWNSHLGHALGPALLRFGSTGQVPISFVFHCAKALVLAAETPVSGVEIINVLDDDLPDRQTYIRALRKTGWPRAVIPMSWRFLVGLGWFCSRIPNLPGLLRPATIKSRMMPLRYSNAKLKQRLGWQANLSFNTAIEQSIMSKKDDVA